MPIGLELLAPARNYEIGKAAVDCGADAVYIASHRFGARAAAGNTMGDIERLVQYAHRYYAKVYLTLNTILFDHELEEARQLVTEAYHAGCDAVIVQDMALLEMGLPPIPLFASTQTHNTTPEKVKFLQEVGFQRVILARELSLEQMAAIRAATTVPLESFVHGALCVSYSGQCYLSQAVTGRSANRGVCAQPCRATYNLVDASGKTLLREKHLLSLRDMQRSAALPDLLAAGISSFKIEGRLKNEGYVKNVVAHYRQQLDALLDGKTYKKASSGTSVYPFTPQPGASFSRGFSSYFIHGERSRMASFNTAKSIGQEMGPVTALGNGWISVDSPAVLHNADGLCYFDEREQLCGAQVNKAEAGKLWLSNTKGLQPGTLIFRNHDHALDKLLQLPVDRKISASVRFTAQAGKVELSVVDEDGVEAFLQAEGCYPAAGAPERVLQQIEQSLQKTGNTIFDFRVTAVDNAAGCFYPLSVLNGWRRELVEQLMERREAAREKTAFNIVPNATPYPSAALDYRGNVANKLSRQFYSRHGLHRCDPSFEQNPVANAELMRTRYCLKYEMGYCPKQQPRQKLNEPLYLLNNGLRLRLSFDCSRCEMVVS